LGVVGGSEELDVARRDDVRYLVSLESLAQRLEELNLRGWSSVTAHEEDDSVLTFLMSPDDLPPSPTAILATMSGQQMRSVAMSCQAIAFFLLASANEKMMSNNRSAPPSSRRPEVASAANSVGKHSIHAQMARRRIIETAA
jgi:hypothetical protein